MLIRNAQSLPGKVFKSFYHIMTYLTAETCHHRRVIKNSEEHAIGLV